MEDVGCCRTRVRSFCGASAPGSSSHHVLSVTFATTPEPASKANRTRRSGFSESDDAQRRQLVETAARGLTPDTASAAELRPGSRAELLLYSPAKEQVTSTNQASAGLWRGGRLLGRRRSSYLPCGFIDALTDLPATETLATLLP